MADCNCPLDGVLESIPSADCPFNIKQIQKLAFVVFNNGNFDGTAGNDITLKADWDTRLTAVDSTKQVITPFVGGDITITAGEPITNGGGDNSTLGGITEVNGFNPSSFTARWDSLTPAQEEAFKKLNCYDKIGLGVIFINQDGDLFVEELAANSYRNMKIETYAFGDKNNQGFGTKDFNTMTFQLQEGWSENLARIDASSLDFDALTDLVNP